MKILFITHTFPPIIGGVESQNYELYTWLSKISDVKLVANKKRWLIPFFLPYAAIRALFSAKNYDAILLGSCILGNVSWFVKKFSKKPVIAVAHGLDLTWKNKLYQNLWIKTFIPSVDRIIAVGNETVRVAKEKGIREEKITFIPNGVDVESLINACSRKDIEKIIKVPAKDKKIILTLGRLAKRKGISWFVENVVPLLGGDVLYVIAGEGADKRNIIEVIGKKNLENKVKLLGNISYEEKKTLYNTADIFVQPNIKVPGDMEGFGLVVIEAASCQLPVIASRLEGLQDSIKDGQNGFLIETKDTDAYVKKLTELLEDDGYRKEFGKKARKFVVDNYSWEKISKRYLEEIKAVINSKR